MLKSYLKCLMIVFPVLVFAAPVAADHPLVFAHAQRSLQPGEVIRITAHGAQPLKSLHAEMFERVFPAFSDEEGLTWTALIGVDLEAKPGNHRVVVKGTGRDGKVLTAQKVLMIEAKKFPTRTLTVDEKYVTPPPEVLARIEEERARVNAIFATVSPERSWDGLFRAPVPGEVISEFGKRNVYNNQPRNPHTGVDFRGATGTPIRAPNAGRVVLAADLYYSGKTVILDHGLGLYSYLAHMSSFSVKEGDVVRTGDPVGKVGATGRVTGPHLHWTVRLVGARVDPLSLISVLGKLK